MKCPKCGGSDFKPILEQRQVSYQQCGNKNCEYNIEWNKVESLDAKEWIESIAMEHTSLQDEAHRLEQELHDILKPTMLQEAKLNRAKRQLEASDKKMIMAESLSSIVEATESGEVTLAIPSLGLFQFSWGDFNLWRAVEKSNES